MVLRARPAHPVHPESTDAWAAMENPDCLDRRVIWVRPVPWAQPVPLVQKAPRVLRVPRASAVIRVVTDLRVCVGRQVTKVRVVVRVHEEHEDQQDLLELKDPVVQTEPTEWSVHPVPSDPLGLVDSQERWGLLVLLVKLVALVHVVPMVLLDLLGLPANPASLEPLAFKGCLVVMGPKVQRVSLDCEVLQDLRVHRAHEVFLVLLELLEKPVRRVQSAAPDLLALLDPLVIKAILDLSDLEAPLAHLVQWVLLDHVVHADVPDRRVQWVRQVLQALPELLEVTVALDSQVLRDDRVPVDVLVRAVKQVLQGPTVLMVKPAPSAILVQTERRERPDLRAPRVHVVFLVNLVKTVSLAVPASLVLLVNKAHGVLLVHKASMELPVPTVQWVPRETEVTKGPLVRRVYKVRLVLLDPEEGLVVKVPRVDRAPWVPTDLPDLEVHAARVVSLETTVKKASLAGTLKMDQLDPGVVLVLPVTVVRLVHRVPLALPVNLESRVMLVPWVLWESWVLQVFLVYLAKMELKVPAATKVTVDVKAHVVFQASTVNLDPAVHQGRRVRLASSG